MAKYDSVQKEFSHINIPILTTTGYYDDGQRGAMYYYNEHLKYNPDAEHFLLIGPYDHWGAQSRAFQNLRGYQIDPVAVLLDIKQGLVFDWFDYILRKRKTKDPSRQSEFSGNGNNEWFSKPSIEEMSNCSLIYYIDENKTDLTYKLVKDYYA
ncbi:MAG: hypothetical protein R2942_12520 [Ignavibacteria bacterium]